MERECKVVQALATLNYTIDSHYQKPQCIPQYRLGAAVGAQADGQHFHTNEKDLRGQCDRQPQSTFAER